MPDRGREIGSFQIHFLQGMKVPVLAWLESQLVKQWERNLETLQISKVAQSLSKWLAIVYIESKHRALCDERVVGVYTDIYLRIWGYSIILSALTIFKVLQRSWLSQKRISFHTHLKWATASNDLAWTYEGLRISVYKWSAESSTPINVASVQCIMSRR